MGQRVDHPAGDGDQEGVVDEQAPAPGSVCGRHAGGPQHVRPEPVFGFGLDLGPSGQRGPQLLQVGKVAVEDRLRIRRDPRLSDRSVGEQGTEPFQEVGRARRAVRLEYGRADGAGPVGVAPGVPHPPVRQHAQPGTVAVAGVGERKQVEFLSDLDADVTFELGERGFPSLSHLRLERIVGEADPFGFDKGAQARKADVGRAGRGRIGEQVVAAENIQQSVDVLPFVVLRAVARSGEETVCDNGGVVVAGDEVLSGRPAAGRTESEASCGTHPGLSSLPPEGGKAFPLNKRIVHQYPAAKRAGAETRGNLLPKGSLFRFMEPAVRRHGSN